jgi:MFS family permease
MNAIENQLQPDKGFFHQPRAVWAITFACVISFMGIGLIDPILPSIAIKLNASPSQVSLLFSSYTLVMSFAMLITGFVSSRFGQKWTMLTGLFLIIIFSTLGGLSNNIWHLVWLRGGWGLGNALFIATALTSIVELSSGGIARAIILYEAAIGLGFSVGPLLGGELGSISWRGPFFGVGILLIIAVFSLFKLLPTLPKQRNRSSLLDPLKALLRYRGLLAVGITALLYYVGFFILLAYSPFMMNLDEHGLGYVFFGWGLMLAITSVFVAPKVEQLLGMLSGIYLTLFLFALDLLIMGLWSSSSTVVIVTVIIAGIFIGINSTLITTAVMDSAPVERSVISSAYNFIRFLGGAIGPLLAGILAEQYGLRLPSLSARSWYYVVLPCCGSGATTLMKISQKQMHQPFRQLSKTNCSTTTGY